MDRKEGRSLSTVTGSVWTFRRLQERDRKSSEVVRDGDCRDTVVEERLGWRTVLGVSPTSVSGALRLGG